MQLARVISFGLLFIDDYGSHGVKPSVFIKYKHHYKFNCSRHLGLSPLLSWAVGMVIGTYMGIGFICLSIFISLAVSLPCFLLLFLSYFHIDSLVLGISVKKIILSIVGVLIPLLYYYLLFRGDEDDDKTLTIEVLFTASYCVVILAGIWFL